MEEKHEQTTHTGEKVVVFQLTLVARKVALQRSDSEKGKKALRVMTEDKEVRLF